LPCVAVNTTHRAGDRKASASCPTRPILTIKVSAPSALAGFAPGRPRRDHSPPRNFLPNRVPAGISLRMRCQAPPVEGALLPTRMRRSPTCRSPLTVSTTLSPDRPQETGWPSSETISETVKACRSFPWEASGRTRSPRRSSWRSTATTRRPSIRLTVPTHWPLDPDRWAERISRSGWSAKKPMVRRLEGDRASSSRASLKTSRSLPGGASRTRR